MMLPTHRQSYAGDIPPSRPLAGAASAAAFVFISRFLHRLRHISLIDLQFSLAQFSLLLFAPRKVYAFACVRKQQRDYFARDDPGFLLLLLLLALLVGLAYGLAFSHSLLGCLLTAVAPAVLLLLSSVAVVPLSYVVLVWVLQHQQRRSSSHLVSRIPSGVNTEQKQKRQQRLSREQLQQQHLGERAGEARTQIAGAAGRAIIGLSGHVSSSNGANITAASPAIDLFFCFDVHLNASFVYMVVGLVLQLFLFPVLRWLPPFLACLLENALQVAAASFYLYITILGYAQVYFSAKLVPELRLLLPVIVCFFLFFMPAQAYFQVNLARASVQLLLFLESWLLMPSGIAAGQSVTLLQNGVADIFNSVKSSKHSSTVNNSEYFTAGAAEGVANIQSAITEAIGGPAISTAATVDASGIPSAALAAAATVLAGGGT